MDRLETEQHLRKYLPLFTVILILVSIWMAFRLYEREQYFRERFRLDANRVSTGWQYSAMRTADALQQAEADDEVVTQRILQEAEKELYLADDAVYGYSIGSPALYRLNRLSNRYSRELNALEENHQYEFGSPEYVELLRIIHSDLQLLSETLPEEMLMRADQDELEERVETVCATLKHPGIWFYCGGPPPTPTP